MSVSLLKGNYCPPSLHSSDLGEKALFSPANVWLGCRFQETSDRSSLTNVRRAGAFQNGRSGLLHNGLPHSPAALSA